MDYTWLEIYGRSLKDRFMKWLPSQDPVIVPVRQGPFDDRMWSAAYKPEDFQKIMVWLSAQERGHGDGWAEGIDPLRATLAFRRWLLRRHPLWSDMSSALGTRAALAFESRKGLDLEEFMDLLVRSERAEGGRFTELISWIPAEFRTLLFPEVPVVLDTHRQALVAHARDVVLDHLARSHGKRCVCAEEPAHEEPAVYTTDGLSFCEGHVPSQSEFGLATILLRVLVGERARSSLDLVSSLELEAFWTDSVSEVVAGMLVADGVFCQHVGCRGTPGVAVARIGYTNLCEDHVPINSRFALARAALQLLRA